MMKKYLLTKLHETRNKKKKGFTLVELIVVLAILAALLIPALTGYIDNANEKKVTAEARTALMAVQTVVSDTYGTEGSTTALVGDDDIATADIMVKNEQFKKLAEGYTEIKELKIEENKVTKMIYSSDSYTATYTVKDGKGTWAVESGEWKAN